MKPQPVAGVESIAEVVKAGGDYREEAETGLLLSPAKAEPLEAGGALFP